MTTVTHTTATAAKIAGQDASITHLTPPDEAAYMAAVDALRPGTAFSANTLRPTLDREHVPERMRAKLMRMACARGLAEPVTFDAAGVTVHLKVPSTGKSAKGAYVGMYRRTSLRLEDN